ncbi:MAG: RNA polymerase sigma factor [Defluviitaleaceae bacterium]|nr:RNA polymerase sigma factor [Defluviitaleaceae bacterium]
MNVNMVVEEYAGKVFGFCLRKCGSPAEAEDLAQDILLCVLSALRERNPDNLAAYIWRIARNRYARWAKQKSGRRDIHVESDVFEASGIIDDTTPFDDAFIRSEDVHILCRELAFIAEDYRQIIVAHYINNQSTQTIANNLNVPRGTVLWRLSRARQKLKEGMEMSRTFGTKNYNPEEVYFSSSGNQNHGLPHSAVQRMLPKNILLQANNNPSTIEELAVEVGIAVPYMHEEVEMLVDVQLLKQVGDKYVTNFFITDKDCDQDVQKAQEVDMVRRAALIGEIATAFVAATPIDIAPPHMPREEVLWTVALMLTDYSMCFADGFTTDFPVKHKHEHDTWGFIGFESGAKLNHYPDFNHCGNGGENNACITEYGGLSSVKLASQSCLPHNYMLVGLLGEILRQKRSISGLSDVERNLWQTIIELGIAKEVNDRCILNTVTFTYTGQERGLMQGWWKAHSAWAALMQLMQKAYDDTKAILRRYANPILEEQINYCTTMLLHGTRGMAIQGLLDSSVLKPIINLDTSTAGVYIEY